MKELDPSYLKKLRGLPLSYKKKPGGILLVKHRIPNHFEAFGLIFHPFYETDDLPSTIHKESSLTFQNKRVAYEKILKIYGISEF